MKKIFYALMMCMALVGCSTNYEKEIILEVEDENKVEDVMNVLDKRLESVDGQAFGSYKIERCEDNAKRLRVLLARTRHLTSVSEYIYTDELLNNEQDLRMLLQNRGDLNCYDTYAKSEFMPKLHDIIIREEADSMQSGDKVPAPRIKDLFSTDYYSDFVYVDTLNVEKMQKALESPVARECLEADCSPAFRLKDKRMPTQELYFINRSEKYNLNTDLTQIIYSFDFRNNPCVDVHLNDNGASKWEEITKRNVQRIVAIMLDDILLVAPRVLNPISGGGIQIAGDFTTSFCDALYGILNGGQLPASVSIVSENRLEK